ncbi:MAG: acyl-CoA dehydrogenase family protein [Proteobacteria bacterium]|nr:acyl-CoA dehydrogenase family protein [Pseudomonadota bacterium]
MTPGVPTREQLLRKVQDLVPVLKQSAAESEKQRRLCEQAVTGLREAGLFKLWCPREVGGYDLDFTTQIDVMMALARADMSACWNVMIGCSLSAVMATGLDDAGLDEIFTSARWPVAAGALKPSGQAEAREDGFVVNGKWGFGSGIHHSDWIVANCLQYHNGDLLKPVKPLSAVIPVSQVQIIDDWYVSGLAASGSSSYAVKDVFVPKHRLLSSTPRRGSPHNRSMFPRLPIEHASVSLGGARHALDEVAQQAITKRRLTDPQTVSTKQAFHVDLGRLEAEWETLYAGVRDNADLLSHALTDRPEKADDARMRLRAICAHTTERCHAIGVKALRQAGAGAVHSSNVLQRIVRDLNVSAQHVMVSDVSYEDYGRALIGASTPV